MFQSETIRERLMHSLKERIARAREEPTIAKTSKPISQITKEKVEIKEEITSASTCSQSKQSPVSSVNQGKQINRTEGPKVFHLANIYLFEKILRQNSSLLE